MKNKSRSKTSMQDSAYDLLGKMMLEPLSGDASNLLSDLILRVK